MKINDENEKNEWANAFKVEVKMEGAMKAKIGWWSLQGMIIFLKKKWCKIKGENEKNVWANVFKMIYQPLDQKYKKKRMKLVKES